MGPVLLQEETGEPEENLRGLVETNWTTFFSHVTKVTSVDHCMEPESNPGYSGERHVHYHCAISTRMYSYALN